MASLIYVDDFETRDNSRSLTTRDDTPIIQAALDAARDAYLATATAQSVQLGKRVYRLCKVAGESYCLQTYTGVTLQGAGIDATKLKLANNQVEIGSPLYLVRNAPQHTSQMQFRDFSILGNRSNQDCPFPTGTRPGPVIIGLLLDAAWDCSILRVRVQSVGHAGNDYAAHQHENYGIAVNNGGEHQITDCEVFNTYGSGFTLMGHDDGDPASARIVRCNSHDNLLMGYALSGARDAIVRGCVAANNGGNGLNDEVGTGNQWVRCVAVGNRVGGRQGGVYYSGKTTRVRFVKCAFRHNRYGVRLEKGVVDGEVLGCSIQDNARTGFLANSNAAYRQSGNIVTGNNPDWGR